MIGLKKWDIKKALKAGAKAGETVETSSFRQAVEAQFDCLSKKVIKRAVMKGYRDIKVLQYIMVMLILM